MSGHYFNHRFWSTTNCANIPWAHSKILMLLLSIWRCSHLTATLLLGTPSIWWFLASLWHWTVLKTVTLYIVAKFYSWMRFPMHSTKCLYNPLYIHHHGRATHTYPIARASLAALALPVVTMGTERWLVRRGCLRGKTYALLTNKSKLMKEIKLWLNCIDVKIT